MSSILGLLSTLFDLLLVVLGFSAIVFVHELGHFIAARWAGIRVLAFAMGFGPAALSYRKGMGWRRGSSEGDYLKLRAAQAQGVPGASAEGLSPTEYRINWLPFGGYVKMLGQDDADPSFRSDEPDSYQSCSPYKRMVVISAGVVMNVIAAAGLFIAVFMLGLKTMPAKVGDVAPGSPAAKAVAPLPDGSATGLLAGDEIVLIDGAKPNSFNDLVLASSLARRGVPVSLTVRREGVPSPIKFSVVPEESRQTGLLEFGIEPARSSTIFPARTDEEQERAREALTAAGLAGVDAGSTLIRAGGKPARSAADAASAFRGSGGREVELVFSTPAGERAVTLKPSPEFEEGETPTGKNTVTAFEHLLGLTPVMVVGADGAKQGLQKGDIFARVGTLEFPSLPAGMTEIRAHARRSLDVVVLRRNGEGWDEVPLKTEVSREGRIGFYVGTTAETMTLVTVPPALAPAGTGQQAGPPLPASRIVHTPGMRVLRIAGREVANFGEIRAALLAATADSGNEGAMVPIELATAVPGAPTVKTEWALSGAEVARLRNLGWRMPFSPAMFEVEEITLKAASPGGAISLGLAETRRVMLSTYATFARLFDGGVKVEHLKGPVGIAHLGTMVAGRGMIWLLFFLGLISVNLAVINFLPLPIVDGGQFLFLVYEAVRGRPASVGFQNAATLAGLLLIGSMFLIVTFNDIKNLLGL